MEDKKTVLMLIRRRIQTEEGEGEGETGQGLFVDGFSMSAILSSVIGPLHVAYVPLPSDGRPSHTTKGM